MPELNRCWFAGRVLAVRLKYGLSIDRLEVDALEAVLAGCESTDLVRWESLATHVPMSELGFREFGTSVCRQSSSEGPLGSFEFEFSCVW